MRAKLVAVAIAVVALYSVASAQSYFIQTGARINLRSWYSTDSRIVETVPSGTTLQVVGKFNRWLKINRNGSEVWMADWVPYTRLQSSTSTRPQSQVTYVRNCTHARQLGIAPVHRGHPAYRRALDRDNDGIGCETSAPAPPQSQPSEINNLCFTVRTCHTDEEWTAGYYAFHGLQPSTSTRSQSQPQSQVTYVRNCTHARQLGIAPVYRGDPAYRRALDRDNDGIGCE